MRLIVILIVFLGQFTSASVCDESACMILPEEAPERDLLSQEQVISKSESLLIVPDILPEETDLTVRGLVVVNDDVRAHWAGVRERIFADEIYRSALRNNVILNFDKSRLSLTQREKRAKNKK